MSGKDGSETVTDSAHSGKLSDHRLQEGVMMDQDIGAGLTPEGSEFLRIAGLRVEEVGGTRVRGSIDLGEQHHTPWGVVHGGVYAAAVESAASIGASAAVEDSEQFAVGVNNNTDFLRPVTEGRVEVVAEPIMQGKGQQLWQVVITRADDGKEVARGQVRLQNVPLP
jgi:1,4-dihydroxy-2-naphthoyl-CoA hydrolase